MKETLTVIALLAMIFGTVSSQSSSEARLQTQLRRLFPSSTAFSQKEGSPPHFKAYEGGVGAERKVLTGFAFWTTELEPLERGYDGPIKILAGIDITGTLTGIIVVDHREPYGYFSIDPEQYAAQFVNKSIRDSFRVGGDIDSISTATLTVTSATRAVRNGARRIARQFITPPETR